MAGSKKRRRLRKLQERGARASEQVSGGARTGRTIPILLAGSLIAAYSNIFSAPFIFDDRVSILENAGIRRLWPLWPALWAPPQMAISGRPVVSFSFALNYALGGTQVWGYHAFNLIIHILNALLIFAIARRTLAANEDLIGSGIRAEWLAGGAALIWSVHPLLSESVAYIMQRTELLMALFLLLTIYAVRRSAESTAQPAAVTGTCGAGNNSAGLMTRRPGNEAERESSQKKQILHSGNTQPLKWSALAILSCALGMGCKEVMAAAPLITLLYDRIFLSPSFAELFRRRWRLYAALFSTWLILGTLLAAGPRTKSVGLGFGAVGPWEYLLTQASVILHYLRLALFPAPLCIDYSDWPIARSLSAALPEGIMVLGLLGLSVWALRSRPKLGFLGALFFLILAPSSSFIPIVTEPAAERRMYLPLLAVVFLAVLGVHALAGSFARESRLRRMEAALLVAVLMAFVFITAERNQAYRTEASIWSDVLAKRPHNARAMNNLGSALAREGRSDEAMPLFARALEIDPNYPEAHNNLGGVYYNQSRMAEAIEQFSQAVRLKPDYSEAHLNLGLALHNRGRIDEAIEQYLQALQLKPGDPEAHNHLGAALLSHGHLQEAIGHFGEALRLRPGYAEAQRNLDNALSRR